MSDSDPKIIRSRFATMNVKISRRQASKIGRSIAREQGEAHIQEEFKGLDQLHKEIDALEGTPAGATSEIHQAAAEKERLVTGVEQASEIPEKAGRGGTIPPKEHRFKPGQSGNPSGRRPAKMTRLVCALLSHNEEQLAKKVVKSWVDQACNGKQSALVELLKRADGIPPSKAVREDLFYNLPPGSMARTRKRYNAAIRESKRQKTPWSNAE